MGCLPRQSSPHDASERSLERETGIEPATNSLEGCDSTTELLPRYLPEGLTSWRSSACRPSNARPSPDQSTLRPAATVRHRAQRDLPPESTARQLSPCVPNFAPGRGEKVGGEGRVRTSVATRAADLQSAAIDRSATSPKSISRRRTRTRERPRSAPRRACITSACCLECSVCRDCPEDLPPPAPGRHLSRRWSWRRDLNPRPADYKSAALPD